MQGSPLRPVRRVVALVVLAAAALTLGARPAAAHAFLVGATPAPGDRLAAAPHLITLRYSEALTTHGSGVDLGGAGGGPAQRLAFRLTGGGSVMEAALPQHGLPGPGAGVYTVSWRAVSADDGHLTAGSFSFGVGRFSGAVPASSTHNPFPNLVESAASWLVVAGAGAALGGLVRPGLAVGLGGAALQTLVVVASPGTSPPRLAYLAVASAGAFAAALALLPWWRRRAPTVVLAAAALVAWVGAGHGPAQAGRVGWATEAAHVVAVSAWLATVLRAAVALLRARKGGAPRPPLTADARTATAALCVVAGTGVALAYEVLPGPGAVLSSAYGRIILAKSVLLVGAGVLALRRRFRAEAAVVLAAVAAAAVLAQVGPPAPGVAVASVLGAPPLTGPVLRTGGLAGDLTVGLAVSSRRLEVEVYAGQAQLRGTAVTVTREGGTGRPGPVGGLSSCGPGCFDGPFTPSAGTEHLAVVASAPGWARGVWVADVPWPPPPQDPAALQALVAAVRSAPRVQVTETVHTAGGQAPPASEEVAGAALLADEPWARGADYASDLPGGVRGLSLYLPGGPIWDTITVGPTGLPATEQIVTSGNRIERRFVFP